MSQDYYEQLRSIALDESGESKKYEFNLFIEYGMVLLVPGYFKRRLHVWSVKRVRASVRAGDFSLKNILLDLGIIHTESYENNNFMEECI